jgi:hypothetical protein
MLQARVQQPCHITVLLSSVTWRCGQSIGAWCSCKKLLNHVRIRKLSLVGPASTPNVTLARPQCKLTLFNTYQISFAWQPHPKYIQQQSTNSPDGRESELRWDEKEAKPYLEGKARYWFLITPYLSLTRIYSTHSNTGNPLCKGRLRCLYCRRLWLPRSRSLWPIHAIELKLHRETKAKWRQKRPHPDKSQNQDNMVHQSEVPLWYYGHGENYRQERNKMPMCANCLLEQAMT